MSLLSVQDAADYAVRVRRKHDLEYVAPANVVLENQRDYMVEDCSILDVFDFLRGEDEFADVGDEVEVYLDFDGKWVECVGVDMDVLLNDLPGEKKQGGTVARVFTDGVETDSVVTDVSADDLVSRPYDELDWFYNQST